MSDISSTSTASGSNNTNTTSTMVFGSKYKHNFRSQLSMDKVDKRYNEIIEILLSPTLDLVNTLCSITLVKENIPNTVNISETLVNFFEIHCNLRSSYLLKWAIDKEIENTSNSATLFRGLSTATRLISAFYKRLGDQYLKYLLQPFVLDLCSRNFSFEIDPDKISKGMDVKSNLERLITITQQLLDKILDSSSFCPLSIRNILQHTQEKVEKKFPEMKTTVVGGFIFLRYICPAIVAPEVFGLIQDNPTTDSRRGLVLVSKLLQNLANEMPFGVGIKEEYMTYLNRFISNNSERIHVFFNELANLNNSSKHRLESNNHQNNNSESNSNSNNNEEEGKTKNKSDSPPLKPVGSVQRLITVTSEEKINYSDEYIAENLNLLINQLIEHKERLESILGETVEGTELYRKMESALAQCKHHKQTFFKFGKKNKELKESKERDLKESKDTVISSNILSGGGNGLMLNNISSKLKQAKLNNQNSSNSLNNAANGGSAVFTSNSLRTLLSSDFKLEATEDDINTIMLATIADYQNYYHHKLELKDIHIKSQQDEIDLLKRELEDQKSRGGLIKKLRDEVEKEKKKRKEAEHQLKKSLEKLKQLDQDTNEFLSRDEDSYSDLSSMAGDDDASVKSSATNTNKKKNGVIVKKSESAASLLHGSSTPSSIHSVPVSSSNGNLSAAQQLYNSINGHANNVIMEENNENEIKRSITNSSIADNTMSQSSTYGDLDGSNQGIPHQNSSGNAPNSTSGGAGRAVKHSRNDSNSEYTSTSDYDAEQEDRIIQACVDGDLEEDDGMDLLQFLKEYSEKQELANQAMNGASDANKEEKKKKTIFNKVFGSKKKSKDTVASTATTTSNPAPPLSGNNGSPGSLLHGASSSSLTGSGGAIGGSSQNLSSFKQPNSPITNVPSSASPKKDN